MVVRGRANTGVGSSARWCSVAVRGGGARFSSQFPVGLASRVPCLVSRVFPCVSCSSLGLGWFGLLLVVRWSCGALSYILPRLAAPRRAQFVLFLLVIFSSCFVSQAEARKPVSGEILLLFLSFFPLF